MKMKITQKQALKMADNIMGCFGIYGYGHFDLIIDELPVKEMKDADR